jgi:hypothetical protein
LRDSLGSTLAALAGQRIIHLWEKARFFLAPGMMVVIFGTLGEGLRDSFTPHYIW